MPHRVEVHHEPPVGAGLVIVSAGAGGEDGRLGVGDRVRVLGVVTNLPAEHRGVELGEPRASGQSSAATTRRAVIPAMTPRYDLPRHLEHSWTETPPDDDGDGDVTCPPLRRTSSRRLTAGRSQGD